MTEPIVINTGKAIVRIHYGKRTPEEVQAAFAKAAEQYYLNIEKSKKEKEKTNAV